MKIIKVKDYDNGGMTIAEAKAEAKKRNAHLPTPDEAFEIPCYKEFNEYTPFWVKTKSGLVARGLDFDDRRRVVYAGLRPSNRLGVLLIENEKPHKHEWKTKKTCECGHNKQSHLLTKGSGFDWKWCNQCGLEKQKHEFKPQKKMEKLNKLEKPLTKDQISAWNRLLKKFEKKKREVER